MEVLARGPVCAATLLWQRQQGWVLTVVCKAAFDMVPGDAKLRGDPPAPVERDIPWDTPYGRSLRVPTDMVPVKQNIDVFLTGHAYAPWGRAVRSLVARLAIGTLDKSIEVVTNRYYDRGGILVEDGTFVRMPLVYERAAGGIGTLNPAGMQVGQRDDDGNVPLPNLVPRDTTLAPLDELTIDPVGFGPIPADWPSRVEKLGRRSLRDLPVQWNGQMVPGDLALDYFNAAPPDQQLTSLRDGDTFTLENLNPSHPRLSCKLPPLRPTALYESSGGKANIALRLDTLHIDTDRAICVAVWRGHHLLSDPREVGRIAVALDPVASAKRRPTVNAERVPDLAAIAPTSTERGPTAGVERMPASGETQSSPFEGTIAPMAGVAAAALPFPAAAAAAAPAPRSLSQSSASWNEVRAPSPLSQSSSSWNEVRAPSPLSQSSSSWESAGAANSQLQPPAADTQEMRPPLPPETPRSEERSSWHSSPTAPSAKQDPLRSTAPLMQSGSWGVASSAPEQASPAVALAQPALPPPALPPLRPASREVLPPAVVSPPSIVSLAVAASTPVADSPWASGSPAVQRETIGMQATSGALALATPRVEPAPRTSGAAMASSVSLQLLWFHPDHVARVRRVPAWKNLLDELVREPLDRDLDDAGQLREPWEIEDRREVFEVLARGEQSDARGVEEAHSRARLAAGKLVPPLVLVEADIEVQLDELEALKAAATTAAPLVTPADETLKAAVEAADQFLGRAGLSAAPSVSVGLHNRIREAFVREKKNLPADYLDKETERALVSGRHYQKRRVLGSAFLRAFAWFPGEKEPTITYLPEDLTEKLPMYRRFTARLIADVHAQQDQYETRPLALRALAVGRVG